MDPKDVELKVAPIKQLHRIKEKADDKYNGDISRVLDVVRGEVKCSGGGVLLEVNPCTTSRFIGVIKWQSAT